MDEKGTDTRDAERRTSEQSKEEREAQMNLLF